MGVIVKRVISGDMENDYNIVAFFAPLCLEYLNNSCEAEY